MVNTKVDWTEHEQLMTTMRTHMYTVQAWNTQRRVCVAAGEMTEDGNKVAMMAMAALDAVIAGAQAALLRECDQFGVVDRQGDVPQQDSR